MKTTIDIADNLFRQVKSLSLRENVTIRDLVEEGLDLMLRRHNSLTRYRAEPVTFKGNGILPEFQNASWKTIRDAVYNGNGS